MAPTGLLNAGLPYAFQKTQYLGSPGKLNSIKQVLSVLPILSTAHLHMLVLYVHYLQSLGQPGGWDNLVQRMKLTLRDSILIQTWFSTSWNQDCGRNINNLRYADDTTLMAESKEELKSLLMKVIEDSEKVGFKTQQFKKLRSQYLVPSLHGK